MCEILKHVEYLHENKTSAILYVFLVVPDDKVAKVGVSVAFYNEHLVNIASSLAFMSVLLRKKKNNSFASNSCHHNLMMTGCVFTQSERLGIMLRG